MPVYDFGYWRDINHFDREIRAAGVDTSLSEDDLCGAQADPSLASVRLHRNSWLVQSPEGPDTSASWVRSCWQGVAMPGGLPLIGGQLVVDSLITPTRILDPKRLSAERGTFYYRYTALLGRMIMLPKLKVIREITAMTPEEFQEDNPFKPTVDRIDWGGSKHRPSKDDIREFYDHMANGASGYYGVPSDSGQDSGQSGNSGRQ